MNWNLPGGENSSMFRFSVSVLFLLGSEGSFSIRLALLYSLLAFTSESLDDLDPHYPMLIWSKLEPSSSSTVNLQLDMRPGVYMRGQFSSWGFSFGIPCYLTSPCSWLGPFFGIGFRMCPVPFSVSTRRDHGPMLVDREWLSHNVAREVWHQFRDTCSRYLESRFRS